MRDRAPESKKQYIVTCPAVIPRGIREISHLEPYYTYSKYEVQTSIYRYKHPIETKFYFVEVFDSLGLKMHARRVQMSGD